MIALDRKLRTMCGVAALAVAAGACATAGSMGGTEAMAGTPQAAAHASLLAVNSAEVEEGQLALSAATDARVRDFATMMVREHSAALARVHEEAAEMGTLGTGLPAMPVNEGATSGGSGTSLTPVQGDDAQRLNARIALAVDPRLGTLLLTHPNARPLVEDHRRAMSSLRTQTGAAFDRAYMDRQVAAHQSALTTLDSQIARLRAAGSSDTLEMTLEMRASVERHLQLAQQLRASLGAS